MKTKIVHFIILNSSLSLLLKLMTYTCVHSYSTYCNAVRCVSDRCENENMRSRAMLYAIMCCVRREGKFSFLARKLKSRLLSPP